jgi:amino acid permease
MAEWSSTIRNVKTSTQTTNLSETVVENTPWRSKGMLEFLDQNDEIEVVHNSRRAPAQSYHDQDRAILRALGKKQLLHRGFGFLSMVGFTSTMMGTWEALGLSIQGGLINGGPVALIYGFILVFFGTLATCASIAELASMFPTAGGQYHFVALLSPKRYKAFLSWIAGKANEPLIRYHY